MRPFLPVIPVIVASLFLGPASAALVWDEAVNGDFSNNRLAPTPLTFKSGVNTFRGSLTGALADGKYYDYVRFTIPSGYGLTRFMLDSLTSANSGSTILGIAKGGTFPSDQNGTNANLMLGWTGMSSTSVGRDMLPSLSIPNHNGYGNSGFSGPLPAGNYAVWIQDYDTPATYQFSLLLEAAVSPTIKVSKVKPVKGKAILSGTATGTDTEVSFRVGTKGAFKKARGDDGEWKAVASKLKKGSYVITIRAKGLFGISTKKQKVVITE